MCTIANIKSQVMIDWNDKVKRLLKSELIKRGISNADLALMLIPMAASWRQGISFKPEIIPI